uniref:Uncharacterized protein n=1 Tax=Plectus sambesii TaxID=2011161 RepID=A0A914WZB0_9BILA
MITGQNNFGNEWREGDEEEWDGEEEWDEEEERSDEPPPHMTDTLEYEEPTPDRSLSAALEPLAAPWTEISSDGVCLGRAVNGSKGRRKDWTAAEYSVRSRRQVDWLEARWTEFDSTTGLFTRLQCRR